MGNNAGEYLEYIDIATSTIRRKRNGLSLRDTETIFIADNNITIPKSVKDKLGDKIQNALRISSEKFHYSTKTSLQSTSEHNTQTPEYFPNAENFSLSPADTLVPITFLDSKAKLTKENQLIAKNKDSIAEDEAIITVEPPEMVIMTKRHIDQKPQILESESDLEEENGLQAAKIETQISVEVGKEIREGEGENLQQDQLKQRLEEQRLEEQRLKERRLEERRLEEQRLELEQRLEEQRLELEQRLEEQRLEERRLEERRLEEQRLEEQRLEEQRLEERRLEEQRLEEQRLEEQRLEEQRLEEQRLEEQRLEEQRLEEQRLEEQRLEEQRLKEQRLEEQRLEEQRLEEQRLEERRLEEQRLELEQRRAREAQEQEERRVELERQRLDRERQEEEERVKQQKLKEHYDKYNAEVLARVERQKQLQKFKEYQEHQVREVLIQLEHKKQLEKQRLTEVLDKLEEGITLLEVISKHAIISLKGKSSLIKIPLLREAKNQLGLQKVALDKGVIPGLKKLEELEELATGITKTAEVIQQETQRLRHVEAVKARIKLDQIKEPLIEEPSLWKKIMEKLSCCFSAKVHEPKPKMIEMISLHHTVQDEEIPVAPIGEHESSPEFLSAMVR